MRLLFLDFDGPLLNFRCAFNPRVPMLDDNAVAVVNHLLDLGFVIVLSATARSHFDSRGAAEAHLNDWGVKATGRLHPDFRTPLNRDVRHVEIDAWFARHPEVDPGLALVLDDEKRPTASWGGPSERSAWIACDLYDGLTWSSLRHSVLYDLLPGS